MSPTRSLATGAALTGLLAVSACGGDAAGDEEQTLTVWHYFAEDAQVELMDTYKERFEEAHDGVTVENVYVPYDEMNSRLVNSAGAGEGPDVAVFNGAEASILALGGALAPIDEYWEGFSDADLISDSVLHEVDEELYAVQGYVNLLGLWYNAEILEEIDVEAPTTMEELEAAMAEASEAGYRGITLTGLPNSQGEWQAYPFLSEEGFSYESPEEEALVNAFTRVEQWVDEGWLSQEAVTWDQTVPFQEWSAGDTAFAVNGNWQRGNAEADADFNYGVVPLPLSESGQVYLGGEGQGIGVNSENPDLAWEYLESTYLDPDGQLEALEIVGSLPSRSDAAEEDLVTEDEILAPFSETVSQFGATYPDGVIPPESVGDVQVGMAQAWSAVIGKQSSPEDAAADAMSVLESLPEQ
ncbi:sugar ABC transporter substrate-binding protein [Nesterenkonia alba]|uniref:sugar ABC transporter substrate-binding protein n=1 Tax=Nesterenkonia alba TaxID=515814 RepID=UPI0003B582D3|nr:extracellular solute-binding protein [Nesterenkonia alba]